MFRFVVGSGSKNFFQDFYTRKTTFIYVPAFQRCIAIVQNLFSVFLGVGVPLKKLVRNNSLKTI